jgi:Family of unknown function (DUF1028)
MVGTACLLVTVLWPAAAAATFSIVARDPATGEIGIAVASRVLAVRLAVPVVDPEVGAIARQSDTILKHGTRAMELLKSGLSPQEVIAQLLREDLAPTHQIGIIDVKGRVAASTGEKTMDWKGHKAATPTRCRATCSWVPRSRRRWRRHSSAPAARWPTGCSQP